MPQTRIIERGFDVVINVLPEIGGDEISRIFEKVYTTLFAGKTVSLAEIQELFGIRKTRHSDRYILHENYHYDWVYIFDKSISKAYSQVVGVSITVSGFYKERKKRECILDKKKTCEDQKYSLLPLETDENGTYAQIAMRL